MAAAPVSPEREDQFESAARRARALGSSRSHISPRYYARWSPRGAFLSVRQTYDSPLKVRPCRRGNVHGFSRRSRTRLLQTLAQCDRYSTSKSLFVTLTYPRSFPTASSTYKRHLDTFSKRLRRAFPHASAIWKYELQRRGAGHFHLIVMGVPFIARQWLSKAWYETVKSHDERHLRAGTQVQRIKSYRKALGYAAKYVAKVSDSDTTEDTGRVWGIIGRESLPRSVDFTWLDRGGYYSVVRSLRKLVASRSKCHQVRGFAGRWAIVRGDRAEALVSLICGM